MSADIQMKFCPNETLSPEIPGFVRCFLCRGVGALLCREPFVLDGVYTYLIEEDDEYWSPMGSEIRQCADTITVLNAAYAWCKFKTISDEYGRFKFKPGTLAFKKQILKNGTWKPIYESFTTNLKT